MKTTTTLASLLFSSVVLAAPKATPVAKGFPDWQGLTEKNRITGRELTPSDLRHKTVVVFEIEDNEKLAAQLVSLAWIARYGSLSNGMGFGDHWDDYTPDCSCIVLVNARGGLKPAVISEILSKRKGLNDFDSKQIMSFTYSDTPFYSDVTYPGAPDTSGKRPYVYVLGPTGTEPVFQGEMTAERIKELNQKLSKKAFASEKPWRQFYGSVEKPSRYPALAKAVEKGKPLEPIAKAILKDVTSADEEKARDAQTLYDAIHQARGELIARIKAESDKSPQRAYYDLTLLTRYFPDEKAKFKDVSAKVISNPEAVALGKALEKVLTWKDPSFVCKNAGEAKKIVAELNKIRKSIEPIKGSKTVKFQDGALILEPKIDELIAEIPNRVAGK